MVAQIFETLLQEVGGALGGLTLKPDANNSCLVQLPNGVSIQMDLDANSEYFILGSDLGSVPIGKYRGQVFCQALKANNLPYPKNGIFAYSKHNDHLILFEKIPVKELTGEKILSILLPLSSKALVWKSTISQGEVPALETKDSSQQSLGGLFGLKK